jgi:hypothetical protein
MWAAVLFFALDFARRNSTEVLDDDSAVDAAFLIAKIN